MQPIFTDIITQKAFILRACNKMEPKYDSANSNTSKLIAIFIHYINQSIIIRSEDQDSLDKLY